MQNAHFTIPLWLDLTAAFAGALSGATAAARRRYDIIGAMVLAIAAGLGGALMRDGMFIQDGPPVVLRNESYTAVCVGTALFMPLLNRLSSRATRFALDWTDSLALGLYGIIGTQTALGSGLGIGPSVLVGIINAVGGGVVRDLLIHEEPMVFKPGNYYAASVAGGAALFALLTFRMGVDEFTAGIAGATTIVGLRAISIRYDLRTHAVDQ